jgi:hypothetical protein
VLVNVYSSQRVVHVEVDVLKKSQRATTPHYHFTFYQQCMNSTTVHEYYDIMCVHYEKKSLVF